MKNKKLITGGLILLLAVPAIYILVQVGVILHSPYETQTAIQYTMTDSVLLDGTAAFQQQRVDGSGQLGYLVDSGQRVPAGAPVAEIYQSAEQARSRNQLKTVENQISLLERSQNASGTDVGVQIAQSQAALYDLLEDLDRGNYADVQKSRDQYLIAANRLQVITGRANGFDQMMQQLTARREELAAAVGSPQTVTAPVSGYFVAAPQAKFFSAAPEELEAASPEQLNDLLEQGVELPASECAGKMVTSYQWQYHGVCSVRAGERFAVGQKVTISFPEKLETPLPAKVTAVEVDEENDLVKVTIECEYVNSQILALGQQPAQVDFEVFEGLRIDAQALHIVDGSKGVYVKYGNLAKFRKIQILYQDDEYILVPLDGAVGSDNEVRRFDEVIVKGSDLKDGKLL